MTRKFKKQMNTNTRRIQELMRDVRNDVVRRTRNSKKLDVWLEKLSPYTEENCFTVGIHNAAALDVIKNISKTVEMTKLPPGVNSEIVKGIISETSMHYITNMGEDLKTELRQIAVESYNNNLAPKDTAKLMEQKIDSLTKTRAECIARTETMRAGNLSNLVISRENGANSYTVSCDVEACEHCLEVYKDEAGEDIIFSIDDTENFPPFHPNCYMPDTQVFTNNGWKYFFDINEEDKILTLNPLTNETEFIPYLKVIKTKNPTEYMYHIHNKWFDTCVTYDHDCFIHQRKFRNKKRINNPEFRKPTELNSESKFYRQCEYTKTCEETININGLKFKSQDFAFFMSWFISEGSVLHNQNTAKDKNYPIKITQKISSNREIILPVFERMSEDLGIPLYIGKEYFEFHSKELHNYLLPLGYSHEKYIPKEIFSLDKECLNIFLDNYVLGDGHERTCNNEVCSNSYERVVFTSSPQLRDDLSYLILLCGFCPSISLHSEAGTITTHKNGVYTQNHNVYGIRINHSKYANYSSCNVEKINYTGEVYCVELPKYHTLWTLRNGKTSWNGNCRCTPRFSTKTVEERLGE